MHRVTFFSSLISQFSRYVDETCTESVLLYDEAVSFHLALYTNWMIGLLCYQEVRSKDDDQDPLELLHDLDDESLCDLYRVRSFLDELHDHTYPYQGLVGISGEFLFCRFSILSLLSFSA